MERLFMFWSKPTNNFLGTDGSSVSFEIMTNGDVIERRYPTLSEKIYEEQVITNSLELAKEITDVIDYNWDTINSLPDFVNNDTYDGSWQTFIFYNKKVTVDNLHYTDVERFAKERPQIYEQYREVLNQSAFLWSVYQEIKGMFSIVEDIEKITAKGD